MIKQWGVTFLKLDRQDHYGKKDSNKKGNYRAVAMEALAERYSAEPDIDHSKTKDNIYICDDGFKSYFKSICNDPDCEPTGEALGDYYDDLVADYRDPRGHKFRKDGIIAGAAIVKPSIDDPEWMKMNENQKVNLLMQSLVAFQSCFANPDDIVIDCAVIQFDEANIHIHIFFHDKNFALADKMGLPFEEELHRGKFIECMKDAGYDLEPHKKSITDDEQKSLKELKQQIKEAPDDQKEALQAELFTLRRTIRARKKKNGQSSAVYKANKDAEKIKASAEHIKNEAERIKAESQKMLNDAQNRINEADQYATEKKAEGERKKERLISEGVHGKRQTLSEAQKLADETIDIAGRKADRIISNAKKEADDIIGDAHKVRDAWQGSKPSVLHNLIVDLQLSSDRLNNYKRKVPDKSADSRSDFTQEYKQKSHKNKNDPSL